MTIPRHTLLRLLASLPLLASFGVQPASAADAAKTCRSGDTSVTCRYAKGLLWKIERSGRAPSHLFGTIHVSDPRVTSLPAPVRTAFNTSHTFAMELIFDGAGFVHMAETMFFSDGRTLDTVIGAERYKELRRALTEQGVPLADLNRKKPWVAVMMLSGPGRGGLSLDMQLHVSATLQNKPAFGLETMQEQLAVFNGMAMEDQVVLLDNTLRYHNDGADKLIETMMQAYLARDLTRIMEIANAAPASERGLQERFMARLLTERNLRMAERMQKYLEQGNAFVAVGAAHLPGQDGLLALLERAGWRVTPVY
jgi:uncharacterized protein YbaP (TraB family)